MITTTAPDLRCPCCGHADALIALGTRWVRPHRWRRWITTLCCLYLCDDCDAVVSRLAAGPTTLPQAA